MLYAATGRALFVGVGLALFVGGAAVLYNAIDHVQDRITIWLQPWTDERVYCSLNGELELRQDCASYQLVKSLYSIANGGFGGTGLGQGTFTSVDGSQLIPYLRTDFIFSAIAQELGLIGAAALLLVFMLFVVRGMRVAAGAAASPARPAGLVRLRAADVHHRRRRPPDHPADRDHAPVRELRRLEHRCQLPPARGPPARLDRANTPRA
jgi:peptidoglycan glycosyltransferase